jgi:hypothetical protein
MDIQKAKKKIRALIAQAADDSVTEEEARSHALKAVKLIDEHDLVVVTREEEARLSNPVPGLDMIGKVAGPEVGSAVADVIDFATRVAKSGLVDAGKRAVGSARRAAAATSERRSTRRRRGL